MATDLDRLEEIEKATLRLVTQAIDDFRGQAAVIFAAEKDRVADIGEDLTREALDRLGVSKIEQRIFGKMDYKRPRYVFEPEYAVRQAMLVDSKAEAADAEDTATLQTAQTSLRIRHMRSGAPTDEPGTLPAVITTGGGLKLLSTTVFVKYNYTTTAGAYNLASATVAALPNGMLQVRYNPTAADTIWRTGRNAPTRGEPFRARLVFARLKAKASWRVQSVPMGGGTFTWVD